ncbi:MAG: DUF924 family protein [Solirubrobacterales bacterium]
MSTDIPADARRLLDFWFAPGMDQRWFAADAALDADLAAGFRGLAESAAEGRLDHWAASPEGALALVLLLDQAPRNLWRGTARAFATDARARAVAAEALARGFDRPFATVQRQFLYLPFEHSEDLADQDRAVALFREAGDTEGVDWAERHRAVIARFGRFPHRNAALGRTSTTEELAYLAQPSAGF